MPGSIIPTSAFSTKPDLTGAKGGMFQAATGPIAAPNLPLGMVPTPTYTSLGTKQFSAVHRSNALNGSNPITPPGVNSANPGAVRGSAGNPGPKKVRQ